MDFTFTILWLVLITLLASKYLRKPASDICYEWKSLEIRHVTSEPPLSDPRNPNLDAKFVYRDYLLGMAYSHLDLEHLSNNGYEIKSSYNLPPVTSEYGIEHFIEIVNLQRSSQHSFFKKGIPEITDEQLESARKNAFNKYYWLESLEEDV